MTANQQILCRDLRDITELAFDSASRYLACACNEPILRIWDLQRVALERELTVSNDAVQSVAYHPVGQILAVGGMEGVISLWEPNSGKYLGKLDGLPYGWVHRLQFSADGRFLAAGTSPDETETETSELVVWEFDTRRRLALRLPSLAAVFSMDGKRIFTGSCDDRLSVYDLRTGQKLQAFGTGPLGIVPDYFDDYVTGQICLSYDERHAAWTPKGTSLVLWDLWEDAPVQVIDFVDGIAGFASDGTGLLFHRGDGWASEYTLALLGSFTGLVLLQRSWEYRIMSAALSPNDRWAAVGDDGGSLILLEDSLRPDSRPLSDWDLDEYPEREQNGRDEGSADGTKNGP
jgi:WD40 repeat protein